MSCPRVEAYNSGSEELLNPMNKTVDEFNVNEHAKKYHMILVAEYGAAIGFNQ